MTLIATHLSRHGIVLSSDSNLTDGVQVTGQGPKNFKFDHLRGGLSVAGAYSVGGERMGDWMPRFIRDSNHRQCRSLADFAESLRAELESKMTEKEKDSGSMIHIAGYQTDQYSFHPEFHMVTNIYSIDPKTGEYGHPQQSFKATEDFWSRDCLSRSTPTGFWDDTYYTYANGFAQGRIAFVAAHQELDELFTRLWKRPGTRFRPPKTLQEFETFAILYISIANTLFMSSDYSPASIGGNPQTISIVPPFTVHPAAANGLPTLPARPLGSG